MIALSIDSAESHQNWIRDIADYAGKPIRPENFPFPIIADEDRHISNTLGIMDPDELDKAGLPLSARAVLIIGPDFRLKLSILYPATTGRNFDEILRVLDSLQLTAEHKVATPVDWRQGDECMVQPSVTEEDAQKLFGVKGVKKIEMPSSKSYMRLTPQP